MFSRLEAYLNNIPADKVVAIDSKSRITYSELLSRAQQVSKKLGVKRQLVLLECNISIDWLVAYVSTLIGGHVPILLPKKQPATLDFFNQEFKPNFIIKTASKIDIQHCHDHPVALHDDLCLMLSTSGSTGSPKCVKLSNNNLNANSSAIAEYLKITQDDIGTVSLPTNYSFGLSIINSHLYVGATILFNKFSMIEDAFWDLCSKEQATSFSGVPHNYELLCKIEFETKIPATIRYFTQAGGKLAKDKVEQLSRFAQSRDAEFFVMYGQTEASPRIAYLPPEHTAQFPDSIGTAIPGGKLWVIDELGNELPDGADGELIYQGPNVMMGYAFNQSDLTIKNQTDRLSTGDIAKKLDNGLFVITGRKSRFIKIFGNRISLDQVEELLHEAGYSCIATGIDEKLVVLTLDKDCEEEITQFLSKRLKLPTSNLLVEYANEFPTLPTGKIDYPYLIKNITSNHLEQSDKTIHEIYISMFGKDAKDKSHSFIDLGGDSLTYIQVMMELENILGKLPENWHTLSINELEKAHSISDQNQNKCKSNLFNRLENIDTLRAIVCILVVAFHVFGNTPDHGLKFAYDSPYRSGFDLLELLRMPLFTALAGMLFVAMSPSATDFSKIVKNKVLTLVLPALVVSIIYFQLRSYIGRETGELLPTLLYGYMHLWYLYALFVITIVIGTIHVFLKPSLFNYLGLAALFYIASFYLSGVHTFQLYNAAKLAPHFILGMLLYQHTGLCLSRLIIRMAIAVTLVGCLLKLVLFFNATDIPEVSSLFWSVVSLCFILVTYRFTPKINSIQWIGIYTFAIYLWHPMANASVRTLLMKIGVDDKLTLFICGLAVGVFIPIAMYKAAQFFPKTLRQSLMGR
ncbi:AMP-binding protein [Pseudoalteromonas sp. SSM20]|uniref:AMP-binding protein n=1 Tax=Pseudoalteromonas sp. SSM20 TaxID=3139394 RepID=UPI003BAD595A